MVGRSAALAQLLDLVPSAGVAVADLPTVALVAGEAGVGKTRLLRELVAALPPEVTVLSAAADPDALSRPYSLARSALGESLPTGPGALDDPDVVVSHLAARLGERPAVVIFEDLHWADAESATVIDRLAQLPSGRLLLVGSYRPEDLSRRLPGGDLLSRLERRHAVERVRIDRLDLIEVGALVAAISGEPPTSAVIEALYSRSGGNPFFIEEILTAAGCRVARPGDLLGARLPWSLEEAVRSQLDGLSPIERRVLEAAAVCGPTTRFDVLARAADMQEAELLDVLRALVRAGLLEEAADDRFSFRHALVSDEVERQLFGRERRLLHQRALDALLAAADADDADRDGGDRAATTASAARHAAGAGRFDDFVVLARDGAQHYLRQGSTFQSLRLADEALREAPEDATLLAVAAESAWLISLYNEAISYTDRWVAVARATDDPEEEAAALRWRLRLHHDMGHPDRVDVDRDRLADLIGVLPVGGRRARAMAAIAQSHMLQDHRELAVEWADRAIAAAEDIGDHSVAAQARLERGSALNTGEPGKDRDLRAAIDEAEALGEWVLVTRGLNNLFEAVPIFTPEGRALVERFRRAAGRAGFDSMSHAIAAVREGEIAFGVGDLRAARRAKERGEEWWLRCGQEADWLASLDYDLAFEEGRTGDAQAALERLELGKHRYNRSWQARAELQLAWLRGDADAVRRWFGEYVVATLPSNLYFLPDVLAVVDLALDGGVDAETVRTGIQAALESHPSAERAMFVLDGLLWAAEGDPGRAADRLGRVLEDPDPTLPRAVLGHLRTRRAQALLAFGDRASARDELHRALEADLARWPGWRRDRAAALLARLEGGGTTSDGELTAREREVAALLSEGLTNGELGRRLYISPKTVAVHVSNILTKLHLSNRAEIAAWAVRTGVVQNA